MNALNRQPSLPAPLASLAVALDWPFLRRTVVATVVCSLIIAVCASGYGQIEWAGRYLIFALWPMGLYAITGLVLRCMIEGKQARGFALMAAKIAGLAALYAIYTAWPVPKDAGRSDMLQASAMFFGVATPFAVFFLRFFGLMMETQRKQTAQAASGRAAEEANLHP